MEWEEREESTGRHFLWWQEYSGEGTKQWRAAHTNLFFPSTKRPALGGSDFVLGSLGKAAGSLTHLQGCNTASVAADSGPNVAVTERAPGQQL